LQERANRLVAALVFVNAEAVFLAERGVVIAADGADFDLYGRIIG
jgi:hypothetical protein